MPSWIRSRNGQALVAVVLGDRDDEAEVRLDHLLLRVEVAALDPLREVDLLLGGEQADLADVLEEQLQRVRRHVRLQVERGRLAPLAALRLGALGVRRRSLGGIDVVDHLHALALQVPVELLDVALVDLDLGQRLGDLAVGDHAHGLTLGDEVLDLLELLKFRDQHRLAASSFLVCCRVSPVRLYRRQGRRESRADPKPLFRRVVAAAGPARALPLMRRGEDQTRVRICSRLIF